METDTDEVNSVRKFENNDTNLAINKSVLNYYKKFGRKRDLEQYFSLSTAQGDVRDRASSFWKTMKSQQDSSDSDKRSESATELCRISIKCFNPNQSSSSQEGTSVNALQPVESESPPIVTDDVDINLSKNSEAESDKCDLNISLKSIDPGLDTSTNRAVSPTSSITSHRKLEWDSLADVGYDNENLGKNTTTSLSTLERLALRRQYTINEESKFKSNIGLPTAESTPLEDQKDLKSKFKATKKSSAQNLKLTKKDVVNLKMHPTDAKSVNVNLTKHISFNVNKEGGITENISRCTKEDASVETESPECIKCDKEIQTSLPKNKIEKDIYRPEANFQKVPLMINLNSLKKYVANRQPRYLRRKKRIKRKLNIKKKNTSCNEKSGEQVSEAESFEYMPGHIYNQTKHVQNNNKTRSFAGNKSSLESSGGITTGSSKTSSKSFSKDLDKGVELLSNLHNNSSRMKKKLIKDIVKRLINSKYKSHDTIDSLTGLTPENEVLRLDKENFNIYTSSSTSDHNSRSINKVLRPKKSILRKLNSNTTQSVPNLAIASTSKSLLNPREVLSTGHIDTDGSSKDKNSLKLASSEELYKKYLEAKKREQMYKKQLADKEKFIKMKLLGHIPHSVSNEKLDNIDKIVKDLSKNNYVGSGDANSIQQQLTNNNEYKSNNVNRQVIHPVFTLSSSDYDKRPQKKKNIINKDNENTSKHKSTSDESNIYHYCCPYHTTRIGVTDSAIQVNVDCQKKINPESSNKSNENVTYETEKRMTTTLTSEVRYVCLCAKGCKIPVDIPDYFSECKCSHMLRDTNDKIDRIKVSSKIENPVLTSRSSQTDLNLKLELHKNKLNKEYNISTSSSKERITQINLKTTKGNKFKLNTNKCIQTDITINPKISEASLSDVNIYNEIFELATQQRSGSSTTENISNLESDTNMNIQNSSCHKILNLGSENQNKQNVSKGIEIDCQTEEKIYSKESQTNICSLDEYTLLLKGTNMELKVGIDDRYKQFQDNNMGILSPENNIKIPDESARSSGKSNSTNKTNKPLMSNIKEKFSPRKYNSNGKNSVYIEQPKHERSSTSVEYLRKKIISNEICSTSSNQLENHIIEDDSSYQNVSSIKTPSHEQASTLVEHLRKDVKSNENSTNSSNKTENNTKKDSLYYEASPEKLYTADNKNHIDQIPKMSKLQELPKYTHFYGKKVSIEEPTKYFTYPSQNKPISTEYSNTRRNTVTDVSTKYNTQNENNECNKNYPTHNLATNKFYKDNLTSKPTPHIENIREKKIITSKNSYTIEPKQNTQRNSDNSNKLQCSNSESNKTSILSEESGSCTSDPIIDLIKDITRRYSKRDSERYKRRKCFKEIMTVLNYLVDTDESTDTNQIRTEDSFTSVDHTSKHREKPIESKVSPKQYVDRGIQLDKMVQKDLSDILYSSDIPGTSSESYACKILTKIQKQCEEYNKKKKTHKKKPRETSSSTSVGCEKCKKSPKCSCKITHKCKNHKAKLSPDKSKRKCIAYNLIIQASDSIVCEEASNDNRNPLRNIIVKVPKRRHNEKEIQTDIGRYVNVSPKKSSPSKSQRSRSLPNDSDISSTDGAIKLMQEFSVRDYLERNRPDFIENTSKRQDCLKKISETRANERYEQRRLLSLRLARQPDVSLSVTDLRSLAKQLGIDVHHKIHSPKLMSEKAMKKHSEKIYKTLPEVVRKKDELKKEKIKKTNLIMASLFNKNLQKKTLRGAVNLSNYSTVIKI